MKATLLRDLTNQGNPIMVVEDANHGNRGELLLRHLWDGLDLDGAQARGTLEALFVTPVRTDEILLGKTIPYFALGMVGLALCLLAAKVLFHVPFRGSLLALYAICAAFLVPALGQGLLISAGTKNQFLASQLALLSAFLPTFLLSGFLFEINSMPRPIQLFTMIVPARYLIPSLTTLFLAGDLWPMFLRNIATMLLFGVIFVVLAARTTRKRIV